MTNFTKQSKTIIKVVYSHPKIIYKFEFQSKFFEVVGTAIFLILENLASVLSFVNTLKPIKI